MSGWHGRIVAATAVLAMSLSGMVGAEPVVIRGTQVPSMLGSAIGEIRLMNHAGRDIPFQIDEVTSDGEYVLPSGTQPNDSAGNGVLDAQDEIVFMRDDISGVGPTVTSEAGLWGAPALEVRVGDEGSYDVLLMARGGVAGVPRESRITYEPASQQIRTPHYTAAFGRDRFHFVQAGVHDSSGGYTLLARELRIEISLRAFWGIVPIRYTEESIVCVVQRYKAGPIRLIRRGDFHLKLGLGIKGSRAVVYQMCYPDLVVVPVRVHLPVRFRSFFQDAHIEMTPVLTGALPSTRLRVASVGIDFDVSAKARADTLVSVVPDGRFFTVDNGSRGFGWLLQTSIPPHLQSGSGYVVQAPSNRGGPAHCGYRLSLTDLPKGYYRIVNMVVFARDGAKGLAREGAALASPTQVRADGVLSGNTVVPRE